MATDVLYSSPGGQLCEIENKNPESRMRRKKEAQGPSFSLRFASRANMSTLTGATRTAFLAFFASHIPITLCVDGQAFLPRSLYPSVIRDVLDWYTSTFSDNLMRPPTYDVWFSSVVACEIMFQLPFFVYAVYALLDPTRVDGRGGFRTTCLVYGSHTATTLVPILATIAVDPDTDWTQRATLFGFYLPYLIFPLWLVYIAARNEDIFGASIGGKSKSK